MDTRKIISDYYACWTGNDREGARALLADNLLFRSPMDNFDSADEFMAACWPYSENFNEFEPVQEAYAADSAYIAYPVGEMMVGEFHRFRDGRICEVHVTFNVTA